MNKKDSFFCRTKENESENEEEFDFDAVDRLERGLESTRPKSHVGEDRLKEDELRRLSDLYSVPAPEEQGPRQDSFEFLDRFKQRMKNSFVKKTPPPSKQSEPETVNSLERLQTEISTQLSIGEDDKVNDDELSEVIVEKNQTAQRYEDCDLEVEKENVEIGVECERFREGNEICTTRESTPVNRVTLSQLSARLSKSASSKSRGSKERPSQKRKISDYFNPLNKKLNCE